MIITFIAQAHENTNYTITNNKLHPLTHKYFINNSTRIIIDMNINN